MSTAAIEEVTFAALLHKLQKGTNRKSKVPPTHAKRGDSIIAQLRVTSGAGAICVEKFDDYPQMGRFTLRDQVGPPPKPGSTAATVGLLTDSRRGASRVKPLLLARLRSSSWTSPALELPEVAAGDDLPADKCKCGAHTHTPRRSRSTGRDRAAASLHRGGVRREVLRIDSAKAKRHVRSIVLVVNN